VRAANAPQKPCFIVRFLRLGLLCAALQVHACKPAVGSSCATDEARCLDKSSQLSCDNGRFIQTPCRGPAGCSTSDRGVRCDISGNRPGDACSRVDEGAASCVGQRMIVCRGGQYVFAECRGAKGCSNEAGRAVCDTSLALRGDACNKPGAKACSKDGKEVLSCQAGEMSFLYFCRGEVGCNAAGGKLNCDMSVADPGDACDRSMEGKNACSGDGSRILVCREHRFTDDEKCKPGTRCSTEGGGISCTKPERKR
jgi:hypothetical protein